jgi:hypothetical protein
MAALDSNSSMFSLAQILYTKARSDSVPSVIMSGDWESLHETQMELHVVVSVAKPIEQML